MGTHFLDSGSVGKPEDVDCRAGYVLIAAAEEVNSTEFVRVQYDVEQAADDILHTTLPNEFADQLGIGGDLQPVEEAT